jgi:salicylate biosynthesis isochorismate synthase/menaquinone-specific isochorismate synthase
LKLAARAHPFELTNGQAQQLLDLLASAVTRARRTGEPTLAALTLPLPGDVDPSAVALASRRPGEPWFVLEQPARQMMALAGLGAAIELRASGPHRFADVGARWRALSAAAIFASSDGLQGGGPLAMGGFAFAGAGGEALHWASFPPASLAVPEIAIARAPHAVNELWPGADPRAGEAHGVRLTLCSLAAGDDVPEQLLARLRARVAELRPSPLPLLDPDPAGRYSIASAMPPEHYEAAVARAVELIAAKRLQKIVLAREVHVHAPDTYDPAPLFGVLRDAFASCFVFCVGRGHGTLIAASPELLVRRQGQRLSTLALAGSSRRSADPAVDAHLGEQLLRSSTYREEHQIVVRRIVRTLSPHAIWVTAPPEPTLARIANIQHLATPIRAQLAQPMDAIELAGLMHPTPAVGAEPAAVATELIPALEGLDRGWYAGPVGWTDATGDGEFCVALRCALLRDHMAHCYAGNGIVLGSEPAAELAETEVKLAALLPLLAA